MNNPSSSPLFKEKPGTTPPCQWRLTSFKQQPPPLDVYDQTQRRPRSVLPVPHPPLRTITSIPSPTPFPHTQIYTQSHMRVPRYTALSFVPRTGRSRSTTPARRHEVLCDNEAVIGHYRPGVIGTSKSLSPYRGELTPPLVLMSSSSSVSQWIIAWLYLPPPSQSRPDCGECYPTHTTVTTTATAGWRYRGIATPHKRPLRHPNLIVLTSPLTRRTCVTTGSRFAFRGKTKGLIVSRQPRGETQRERERERERERCCPQ